VRSGQVTERYFMYAGHLGELISRPKLPGVDYKCGNRLGSAHLQENFPATVIVKTTFDRSLKCKWVRS
jgi:hypothetical protein